jgi:hypothetical protein
MSKKTSLLVGVTLIALALLALAGNLFFGDFSRSTGLASWPLLIVGAGLLFSIPPLLYPARRSLGGLLFPGLPVLTAGLLLLAASLTGHWELWGKWWPLEVIALALSFVLAGLAWQQVWLMLPGSVLGLTGLCLLYSALTGTWSTWAVLWTELPLAVGLPLLSIGMFRKQEGVKLAGVILVGLAGLSLAALSSLLRPATLVGGLIAPLAILIIGSLLIFSALFPTDRKDRPPNKAA